MKKLSLVMICFVFISISLLNAEDKTNLQLQDQLKLVQKIEFCKLDTGIGQTFSVPFDFPFRNCQAVGSLVIEVEDLKLDTCLKAVQARIRDGYDPDYPGDFDNSFLNELMIGVLNQHEDHARRKIAFKLKNPVKDPDISLPDNVLQTRNVMICDVGLSQNHRYVGLNFWQEFVGNRELSDVAACFYLLDHKGNILWRQETKKISDPNWEEYKQKMRITKMSDSAMSNDGRIRGILWYPGAVRDKEPVQSYIISNEGHVLTYHKYFGMWLDQAWPEKLILRDRDGKAIYCKEEGAIYCKHPAYSHDSSQLSYVFDNGTIEKSKRVCIDTKTGTTIVESEMFLSTEKGSIQYLIKTSQELTSRDGSNFSILWVISILDNSGKKVVETIIPFILQEMRNQNVELNIKRNLYYGVVITDKNAGRFFIVSPFGFLEFRFPPLSETIAS